MTKTKRSRNPVRLGDAWRALKKLLADPDRTDQVFIIIDALAGNSGEKQYRRFAASAVGQRVLAQRSEILPILCDREALSAMPEGTLGNAYAAFMRAEQISADGLVNASIEGRGERDVDDANRLLFGTRIRDSHDLWHVVTGYNRDLIGEAMLLSFTFSQLKNPGIGAIVAMAYLKGGATPGTRSMIWKAYWRGRRAAWLPGADWEALLQRPLEAVRLELGLENVPVYDELRSDDGKRAMESQQA